MRNSHRTNRFRGLLCNCCFVCDADLIKTGIFLSMIQGSVLSGVIGWLHRSAAIAPGLPVL